LVDCDQFKKGRGFLQAPLARLLSTIAHPDYSRVKRPSGRSA